MLPPEGQVPNVSGLSKQKLDDRETRQSILVQKSGRTENVVIMQKEADVSKHVQKTRDTQHNSGPSVTYAKQDNLDKDAIDGYAENKRGNDPEPQLPARVLHFRI